MKTHPFHSRFWAVRYDPATGAWTTGKPNPRWCLCASCRDWRRRDTDQLKISLDHSPLAKPLYDTATLPHLLLALDALAEVAP